MKIDNINVRSAIENAEKLLKEDKGISPSVRAAFKLLLVIVALLVNRLGLDSRNSSNPPSSDPNRKRERKPKGTNKRGGQKGRVGANLPKVDDPEEIISLKVDRRKIPRGEYTKDGYESRQVFDIRISRFVTEYQAEVLKDQEGKRYVAPFPANVTRPTQYGSNVKANAVYMSQFQLIPYNRIEDHFRDQMSVPISGGSIYNFNKEAFELLEGFEEIVKAKLAEEKLIHADETGINIDGKRHWLHSTSNSKWTYFYPHAKRGGEAMEEIGILPKFEGVLCHDHWKPYYKYGCSHALCNAHHLRELERAWEQDNQSWAKQMKTLLKKINIAVDEAQGVLEPKEAAKYRKKYRLILKKGEIESPPALPLLKKKRGRTKQTKARNLLERLRDYEDDTLRFMEIKEVPFTNNQGENDIRMTKVQQKISGCFRSIKGAMFFCRIRSYLTTCRKHQVEATQALTLLFQGKLPDFMTQ